MNANAVNASSGAETIGMKRRKRAIAAKVIGVTIHVLYGLNPFSSSTIFIANPPI